MTEKMQNEIKSRHESCYNVAGKRNKTVSKIIAQHSNIDNCLADNPSTPLQKSIFFKECVTRHAHYS